ncbi:hypothetical protein HAX54_032646, partial [Datura stramonium]|nr:hypothetical protein [Datura stramonium]
CRFRSWVDLKSLAAPCPVLRYGYTLVMIKTTVQSTAGRSRPKLGMPRRLALFDQPSTSRLIICTKARCALPAQNYINLLQGLMIYSNISP